jgi:DnaJ homolog subfamily C member 11
MMMIVLCFRASTFGLLAEYGCEKKITQFSHLSATVSIGVPMGVSLKIRLVIQCEFIINVLQIG